MANRYSVTLDVNKAKYTINSPIGLREGDSGTATIVATILDNGAAYSGMTSAQFFAQKPDGTAVATDPATVSGNTITYKVNDNLTTASGHVVNAYFLINKSVSTESFEINIHPSITLHGPSKDYIPGLNDLTRIWQQTINEWQGKFDELKDKLENTDYSQIIKDSLNTALDEAKEAYQAQFNQAVSEVNDTVKALEAKGVEADTEIAKLKTKQDNAETVADSLQATVDQLNKKILDIDKWLDSLHDEFTAKNETYMKSMQAELTKKLADMKASSDSALNVVKGNISTAQSDINDIDSKIVSLNQTLADVSKSVADINVPQIKADVDTANATANKALTAAQNVTGVRTNLLINTGDNNDVDHPVKLPNADIEVAGTLSRTEEYTQLTAPQFSEMLYRFCSAQSNIGMHNLTPGQTYTIQGDVSVSKGDIRFRSQYKSNNNSGWLDYDGGLSDNLASDTSGFTKVKYTFTIPSNATAFFLNWQVYGFDSTTILRFRRMKLEKGPTATDYSLNPLDIATNDGVQTAITNALDKANYSTNAEVDSKIATGVEQAKTYAEQSINDIIGSALTSYLKKADLKQANYDAGFHSDWFGTEADYNSIATKDTHVNYHTKEEG